MGFQAFQNEQIALFTFPEETNKKSYWAIVEWETLELLSEQATLFSACKTLLDQPELDKNLSLLILIKLNDATGISAAKSSIIKIEENPYFFKKYVLHYADTEYDQLKTQQGDKSAFDFLTQQIVSADCFKTYKNEHRSISWQSLVYRIALKLPFLPITINTNKGLASLFEDNQSKVANKNLKAIDDHLSALYGAQNVSEINALPADEILKKLIPILK